MLSACAKFDRIVIRSNLRIKGLSCPSPAHSLFRSLFPTSLLFSFLTNNRAPVSGTRMTDPTPLRLLRSRSASTSSLPRSQLTSISSFRGNRSTSTSGLLLNDGPQYQPAVKLTMWRFINTSFILIVGTSKMFSALHGQPVSPDILDWTIGVIWALVYIQLSILTMILR